MPVNGGPLSRRFWAVFLPGSCLFCGCDPYKLLVVENHADQPIQVVIERAASSLGDTSSTVLNLQPGATTNMGFGFGSWYRPSNMRSDGHLVGVGWEDDHDVSAIYSGGSGSDSLVVKRRRMFRNELRLRFY